MSTRIVHMDTWTESEAGWGQRPDGGSLHLSKDDYKSFVEDYWIREKASNPSGVTPAEYSRPDGMLLPHEVPERVIDYLQARAAENPERWSRGIYITNAQVSAIKKGEDPFKDIELPKAAEEEQPMDDFEEYEYVAYFANMLAGTNRTERFVIEADEDITAEARAKELARPGEKVIEVERCKRRRFRAMLKVTKLYRLFVEEDSFDEARAEVNHQIQEWADANWEDRSENSAEIISLEEAD